MEYFEKIIMKNGQEALLRSGTVADGEGAFASFQLVHGETDYLLTYPDETAFGPEGESEFLEGKTDNPREVEILALVDGKVVGTAGIKAVGNQCKIRHRAEFGISVNKEYWGRGLGKALTEACILCAKKAGYVQLELSAVAENERALALYRKCGFEEFGRNPRGFLSRDGHYQELVHMFLTL